MQKVILSLALGLAAATDSTSWHKNGNTAKDCAWVAKMSSSRCTVKGEEKVLAATACPEACSNDMTGQDMITAINAQWTDFEFGEDQEAWKAAWFPSEGYQFIVPAFGLVLSDGCCGMDGMSAVDIMYAMTRTNPANLYWTGTERSETELAYSVTHDTFMTNTDEMWVKYMKKIIAKADHSFTDCDGVLHEFTAGQMIQMANVTAYYNEDMENTIFMQDNYYTLLTQSEYCG